MAEAVRHRPQRDWWALGLGYWPVALSLLLSLLVCATLARLDARHSAEQERQRVAEQLDLLRSRLELVARNTFAPSQSLEAMIQLDGAISEARFAMLTEKAIKLYPQVRSIAIAPDDVVRLVYPLPGNERALGLDYRSVPAQWRQVQQARESQAALLVGPVQLVQGGQGLILRNPVFLPSSPPAAPRYWGMVSVVADLDRFMADAGLGAHPELGLLLTESRGGKEAGPLIWGQSALLKLPPRDLVQQRVQVPGAQWLLAAQPTDGWQDQPFRWQSAEVLAAAVAGGVLSLLLALLVRQSRVLQQRNETLAREIQEGQQMREQLEESQARFRSMAALASDWVWEQDEQLRFTYISRIAEEATEVQSSSVLGHHRWDSPALLPGIDWEEHKAQLARREPFRDFEYAQRTPDGSVRHVSISGVPFFDAEGRFKGYRGTGRSITEAKEAEVALRRSQQELTVARDRLQAVLDAAQEVAIIATDMVGHILLFNRGAEHMLGYAEAELLGRSPACLHDPQEVVQRAAELSRLRGTTVEGFETFVLLARELGSETREWTYLRKDGRRLWVSLSVSHVRGRDGQAIGYLGVARDITAQRAAESELRQLNAELESRVQQRTLELRAALQHLKDAQDGLLRSEKLAGLGSMVAGVAHELNTPLGNCLTTASTLQERTREIRHEFDSGQMRRSTLDGYLQEAGQACDILLRGLDTANDLVSHFKQLSVDQTSMQRRSYALDAVVGDVISLLRARWKTTPYLLEAELAVEGPLEGYPGPLGQVLSNLLLNALLHAFEGREQGRVRISARSVSASDYLLVVEDDGIGMSEEVRRRAFDPFFTTKMGRGGTGLGLNIVYNLVCTVLGGSISLHSEPGQGSRFEIRLPKVAPILTMV
ncbi:PAS domain S-box protein [Mitsuaria sp. WAJ17]|uniref:PAS domain S-box protein n=1 Tax=Mitsuaria sp. WAJ17 TaxID=2761452 RepID=UPI0016032EC7|nr:PAS domain S-box protein [Mitsuaria sp. WAJ17]MBB2485761.1 PAS domain S-box protein [Mitsuaria sp. WAJ17]